MIELPEARCIAKDLRETVIGSKVIDVGGNFTDHKFTFYYEDPEKYKDQLVGKKVTKINDRNFYIEIEIEDYVLLLRDGANIRIYGNETKIDKSKLLLILDNNTCINITTSMYSLIAVFNKNEGMNNKYYDFELNGIGPLDKRFTFDYFISLLNERTIKLSTKAFLATEQRIVGIGNGIVQDILFNASLHPKRKMCTLDSKQLLKLYNSVIATINEMIGKGGRDTERDIYGNAGGYKTKLSSKTYKNGCSTCASEIIKEQYLGGSIYYCPSCQE